MGADGTTLAWKLVRWLLLALAVPGASQSALADSPRLGPFELPQPRELLSPMGDESFDALEALNGSIASEASCKGTDGRLWIEVGGQGDCIRYYSQGLQTGANPTLLVYFGGDVMLRTPKGVRFITPSYMKQSPATIEADMRKWSDEAGIPAIFVARPGIYGSSGDHNQRRLPREMDLMNHAVDMIRERYRASSLILTGHSAGGQIAAALLERRNDVSAVAISSGLVSVKQVSAFWEKRRSISGRLLYNSDAFYDPVIDIARIRRDPPPQIYMLSDPEDRVVPFFSQLYFVRRLRAEKFEPHHIYLQAPAPQRHILADYAKQAAAMVARGKSPQEIRHALQDANIDRLGDD